MNFYAYTDQPYIPVEFADAAYRHGHSQVRSVYTLNNGGAKGQVFPDCAEIATSPMTEKMTTSSITSGQHKPASGSTPCLPTRFSASSVVGNTEIPEQHSLAYRDLVRGEALDLPSGEAIARVMGVEPLSQDEVGLRTMGWKSETPLWYYILKEAEVRHRGESLGEVGGRIVAEVLLGLIDGDPNSYRNAEAEWRPELREGDRKVAPTSATIPGSSTG